MDGYAKGLTILQIGRRLIRAGAYPLIHRPVHQVKLSPDVLCCRYDTLVHACVLVRTDLMVVRPGDYVESPSLGLCDSWMFVRPHGSLCSNAREEIVDETLTKGVRSGTLIGLCPFVRQPLFSYLHDTRMG